MPAAGSSAAVRRPRPGQRPAAQNAANTGSPPAAGDAAAVMPPPRRRPSAAAPSLLSLPVNRRARSRLRPAFGIAEGRRRDVLQGGADRGGEGPTPRGQAGPPLLRGAGAADPGPPPPPGPDPPPGGGPGGGGP